MLNTGLVQPRLSRQHGRLPTEIRKHPDLLQATLRGSYQGRQRDDQDDRGQFEG